jgi:amylosucrase
MLRPYRNVMLDSAQIELTLLRLQTKLQARFASTAAKHPKQWQTFLARVREHFPPLLERLAHLYGARLDFGDDYIAYHLEELGALLAEAWFARPAALKKLDAQREQNPQWFQSNQMLGAVCYVDLFAKNLEGIRAKIPYLQELGITYLHLMPLFQVPEPENDGGYAVSSYREINPALGTMKQLRALANELHHAGIVLVVDFVFNHTAHDHEWAQRALAGDIEYKDYYFIFPDRVMPDLYDKTLREIFPDVRRGSFTRVLTPPPPLSSKSVLDFEERGLGSDDVSTPTTRNLNKMGVETSEAVWVWTTFNSFQWDLNYSNPAVFNSMAREMLFLANQGIDVLRLDAVAFIWKKLGTNCENLPEAHMLIQAFNLLARIAAPGLLFKSEAIVHPDEVVKYISAEECQLSYNPLLMALLWNSLATRKTRLLNRSMQRRFEIPRETAWVNYVRVHDDIGWTFDDADAWQLGINGSDHRRFLNEFYAGKFPGSFARGLPFQYNPDTGDMRISGTAASLAGLEKGIVANDAQEIEFAIRRLLLIHGIIMLIGGIPLIYLGDEIGTLNDYSYQDDPAKAYDSRWVHRPRFNWDDAKKRSDPSTIQGRVYLGFQKLIALRKTHAIFSGGQMRVRETGNDHLFSFERVNGSRAIVIANFSEAPQPVHHEKLRAEILRGEILHGREFLNDDATLAPYAFIVAQ